MPNRQEWKRRFLGFVSMGVLLLVLLSVTALAAEKFPNRPINIIISWAPGGISHMDAVTLQPHLTKFLGSGVEIVNKPGGSGTVGWNYVANSPPDGYTVAQTNPCIIYTRYTTKTGISDDRFEHITLNVKVPYNLCVKAESPWKTFNEFIAYAKANPEKVTMGTTGIGTTSDLGTLGIEMATGAKFTKVPYKGSGPIFTSLLGGHVDGSFIELSTALPFLEAKKVRVLAVSDTERNFAIPDVPTLKELGYDLLVGTWQGYSVPKGTPKERIKILYEALKTAINSEAYKAYYKKLGGVVQYYGPDNVGSFYENEDKTMRKIIQYSGFKPTD